MERQWRRYLTDCGGKLNTGYDWLCGMWRRRLAAVGTAFALMLTAVGGGRLARKTE